MWCQSILSGNQTWDPNTQTTSPPAQYKTQLILMLMEFLRIQNLAVFFQIR